MTDQLGVSRLGTLGLLWVVHLVVCCCEIGQGVSQVYVRLSGVHYRLLAHIIRLFLVVIILVIGIVAWVFVPKHEIFLSIINVQSLSCWKLMLRVSFLEFRNVVGLSCWISQRDVDFPGIFCSLLFPFKFVLSVLFDVLRFCILIILVR